MKIFRTILTATIAFHLLALCALGSANLSAWVYPNSNGNLLYQPDAQGNHIIDHAGVGYMSGTVSLPNVPTVMTISPVAGDNTANIQNALNALAALPMTNGFH